MKLQRSLITTGILAAIVGGISLTAYSTGRLNSEAANPNAQKIHDLQQNLNIGKAGIAISKDQITQLEKQIKAEEANPGNNLNLLYLGNSLEAKKNALEFYTDIATTSEKDLAIIKGSAAADAANAIPPVISDLIVNQNMEVKNIGNDIYSITPSLSGAADAAQQQAKYYRQDTSGQWQWTEGDPKATATVWTAIDKKDANGNSADPTVTQQLTSGATTNNGITEADITKFLKWVATQAITYVLVIAAIFIILAGYMYITSLGNTTKTEQAKQMLLYITIGVLVVMGAYLVVNTLLSQVATTPTTNPTLIAPTPSLTPVKPAQTP